MNKYKIVGTLAFLVGASQVLYALAYIIAIIPKLTVLYSDFKISYNLNQAYVYLGLLAVMGVISLALGFKLFSKSQVIRKKYYRAAVIVLVINFICLGLLFTNLLISTIAPMYSLINQIQ